jgi:hypothetical protein
VTEERDNRREARKLGKPYRDLYEALRRSTKTINARTFRRWMSRIERLWREPWSETDKLQLGCKSGLRAGFLLSGAIRRCL